VPFKRDLRSVTVVGIANSLRYWLADGDLGSLSLAPLSAIYISLLSSVDETVSTLRSVEGCDCRGVPGPLGFLNGSLTRSNLA
jgi:hypothetical protein